MNTLVIIRASVVLDGILFGSADGDAVQIVQDNVIRDEIVIGVEQIDAVADIVGTGVVSEVTVMGVFEDDPKVVFRASVV